MDDTRAPRLAILASAVLWGTLWIPLRQLNATGLNGAWAITAGFTLPLLLLLPVGIVRRRRIAAGGRASLAAGLLLAVSVALYAEALLRGQVARVILLFYLMPVWSTVLAYLFLGHRVNRRRVLTITLGLLGMLVVFGVGAGVPVPRTLAEWMGLCSGFCWACSMICMQRAGSVSDVDKAVLPLLLLGAMFFLFTSIPGGRSWDAPTLSALQRSAPWLLPFGLVWVPAVIGLTIYGGSRIDAGRVAILLMLEIVIALSTAALLTDEPFGARELFGAALIIGACASEYGGDTADAGAGV